MEIVEAGIVNVAFLKNLITEGRTPCLEHIRHSTGPNIQEQWYWAIVPPRKIEPGDVAQQEGVWYLADRNGQRQAYDYFPVPVLAYEIVRGEIMTLQSEFDRKLEFKTVVS